MMPKSMEGISCEKMTKASTPDSKPLLADESQLLWRLKEPRNYGPSSGSAMGAASKMVESCMVELGCTRRRRMGTLGSVRGLLLGTVCDWRRGGQANVGAWCRVGAWLQIMGRRLGLGAGW